jgi:small-conductance mechanosensitive channel
METWTRFFESTLARSAAASLVLVLSLLLIRRVVVRAIFSREGQSPDTLRRWIVHSRSAVLFVGAFGLVLIWGPELRAFALSLAAFAVAMVIASKELILCVSGAAYRASGRTFGIGDRIEINGVRGDVIDQSLMSTTVLEVGPGHTSHRYTGRAVIVPNSLLLGAPVYSETYTEEFGFHVFSIPVTLAEDWQKAERLLQAAAEAEVSAYLDEARAHMEKVRRRHGLAAVKAAPQVTVRLPEPGRVDLVVRIPVRVRESGKVEDAILRRFLAGHVPSPPPAPSRDPAGAAGSF